MITSQVILRESPKKLAIGPALVAIFILLNIYITKINSIELFILLAVMIALTYAIYSASKIILDTNGLTKTNLFVSKTMNWDAVTSAHVKVKHTGRGSRRVLTITGKDGEEIEISLFAYGRQAIMQLVQAIISEAPFADVDEKVKQFSEGKFPWFI